RRQVTLIVENAGKPGRVGGVRLRMPGVPRERSCIFDMGSARESPELDRRKAPLVYKRGLFGAIRRVTGLHCIHERMSIATGRASDRAYDTLRREILQWRLAPGTVLGEVEQATRLGISRTPLREALSRLAADGVVEARAGRGLVVAAVSPDAVRGLFELREALETAAAALAAERREPPVFAELADEFDGAAALVEQGDLDAYYALVARFDD